MVTPEQRVLVTGGAGFIGSALVSALVQCGSPERITVLDDFSCSSEIGLPTGVHVERADIRDPSAVRRIISQSRPAAVYHLAAVHYIPACEANPRWCMEVNIAGTRTLLEALREQQLARLFFASSAAVYAANTERNTEDDVTRPDDVYGMTKLVCEDLCRLFSLDTGADVVIGRIFNVYGVGDRQPHLIPSLVRQICAGARVLGVGRTDCFREFVHRDDVVRAVLALSAVELSGFNVFNISSEEEYSIVDVIHNLEALIGRSLEIRIEAQRIRAGIDRQVLRSDASKLRRTTGWAATVRFRSGLRELLEAVP